MGIAKEFTQEEIDRYNYLFNTAGELLEPFMKIHGEKHEPANIKKLEKAISMYNEAISIHPQSWPSMWLRAKAYQSLGDSQSAYTSFKRAFEIMPGNPDVVNEYIMEATNLKKTEEALEVIEKASKDFPEHLGIQANYSLLLILAGHQDRAIEQGKFALRMAPKDKITLNLIRIATDIKNGKIKQPESIYELTNEM